MKELITTFIFALVISCLANSLMTSSQPYPWPVGVNSVQHSPFGVQRDEGAIGEMNYVDGARPVKIMTSIDEKSTERNVDLPLGSNN